MKFHQSYDKHVIAPFKESRLNFTAIKPGQMKAWEKELLIANNVILQTNL